MNSFENYRNSLPEYMVVMSEDNVAQLYWEALIIHKFLVQEICGYTFPFEKLHRTFDELGTVVEGIVQHRTRRALQILGEGPEFLEGNPGRLAVYKYQQSKYEAIFVKPIAQERVMEALNNVALGPISFNTELQEVVEHDLTLECSVATSINCMRITFFLMLDQLLRNSQHFTEESLLNYVEGVRNAITAMAAYRENTTLNAKYFPSLSYRLEAIEIHLQEGKDQIKSHYRNKR